MKKIAFIIPYFRHNDNENFPDMFKLWIHSCKFNPTIDWYIFTNCNYSNYEKLKNVIFIKASFDEVKKRLEKLFDFPIALDSAYKLCDFKPTYGEAFQDYLKKYDFWGFCDIDLIWGDIRKFITNKVLEENERILYLGHMSLFKNNKKVNAYYRTLPNGNNLFYKDVFSNPINMGFDEEAPFYGGGTAIIFRENNIKTYSKHDFADIKVRKYYFHIGRKYRKEFFKEQEYKNTIFEFDNGKIFGVYKYDKRVFRTEYLYVHFQKRPLKVLKNINLDNYIIVPPNIVRRKPKKITKLNLFYYNIFNPFKWKIKFMILEFLLNIFGQDNVHKFVLKIKRIKE